MGKANTCYLSTDNLCFTLDGMNTQPETLKDRVLLARNAKKLSQAQLAELAGVSQVTIQHLESGRNSTSKKLVDIGRALGVSAEWLATGKRGNIQARRLLPDESNVEEGPPIVSAPRRIDIVGTAQLGPEGHWVGLDNSAGWVETYSRDEDAYALRLKGDSMAPAIRSGWVAVCEPNHRLVAGEYVMVTTIDGQSMVKELLFETEEGVSLMSINTAYGERRTIAWEDIDKIHYVGAILGPSKVLGRI